MGLLKVDIPACQTEVSFGTYGWCALRGPAGPCRVQFFPYEQPELDFDEKHV